MAKVCPNCGTPIDEGMLFCDNCGTKLDAQPGAQNEQSVSQSYGDSYTQPPEQPQQQYFAPAQQNPPYSQPYQQQGQPNPQHGGAQPPQKNNKGLIIALSIACAVLVAGIVIILAIVLPQLNSSKDNTSPTKSHSATEKVTEAATDAPIDEPTEPPTEAPTEPPTEAPTDPPTEPEKELPYINSLGNVQAEDFTWIADAMGGSLTGSFLGTDDLVGKWKGEIIYDGVWELVYVTINNSANITIQPLRINYGDGWEDESGAAPYEFAGAFDISSVNGAGDQGSINLYTFLESGGTQYAVGTFSVHNSSSADVYMVRP